MAIPALILAALLAVKGWTLLCFRDDKRRAVAGHRRVPERDLLTLALIGGSLAAFFARHRFRHKTRKQPFSTYLQLIAMVQIGVIAGLAWAFLA